MGFIGLKCNEISLSLFCTVPPYTHQQRYMNEDEIDPNTDNFMIFAILYFYNFILVIDTTIQNTDNKISLHFKPMKLIFMNYSV